MRKQLFAIIVIAGLSMLASCSKSAGTQNEETKADGPLPRGNGSFLMYYYPTASVYSSANGNEFTRKDTCLGHAMHICADAGGTVYSVDYGQQLGISKSADGGKTWTAVANSDAEATKGASYVISAGAAGSVYALSSNGSFFVSKNGGVNWEKRSTPCKKDTIHSSPGTGMEAWLAVSADGKKLLAQAWYFEETVLAVSSDEGKTWTAITPPTERNSSRGVGFCGDRIVYSSPDQVFYTDDNGQKWNTSTPDHLYAPNSTSSFYGYRNFVTDGDQFVVGVEVPAAESSRDDKNKYPGAVFVSTDGGKTFAVKPFPLSSDPTPNTSDEYVYLTFMPKK